MSSTISSPRPSIARPLGIVLGLLLLLLGLAWWLFQQPPEEAFLARTEDGLIERITPVFWGIAIASTAFLAVTRGWKRGWYGAWFFFALMLREFDFHTRFTPENLNSIRFWKSGEIPILHKLFAFVLLAGTAVCVFRFLRGGHRWLLNALRERRAYAITIVGILAYIAIPYGLDNLLDMDDLENPTTLFLNLVEECVELGIPILLSVALLQWARSQGKASGADQEAAA